MDTSPSACVVTLVVAAEVAALGIGAVAGGVDITQDMVDLDMRRLEDFEASVSRASDDDVVNA